MNMANLARMAQQMQADMARVEQELRDLRIEGSAGGGVVKAVVTGKQEIVSLSIDPGAVDADDVEMLQDLVVAAVADAQAQARTAGEERLGRVTGGLGGLTGGLGLPGF
ncbi:YbaB/EbfC family nucleoid-associated protein [soil metagenome]